MSDVDKKPAEAQSIREKVEVPAAVDTTPVKTEDDAPEKAKPIDDVKEKPAEDPEEKGRTKPVTEAKEEVAAADEPKHANTVAEEPKPAEVTTEEPKPAEATTQEPKPAEVTTEETKPAEVTTEETKSEEVVAPSTEEAKTSDLPIAASKLEDASADEVKLVDAPAEKTKTAVISGEETKHGEDKADEARPADVPAELKPVQAPNEPKPTEATSDELDHKEAPAVETKRGDGPMKDNQPPNISTEEVTKEEVPMKEPQTEEFLTTEESKAFDTLGGHVEAKAEDAAPMVEILDQLLPSIPGISNVDVASYTGETALHLASAAGEMECVIALIEKNANINAVNCDGIQAIHIAAAHGQCDILQFLIEQGGLVNVAATNSGMTPLHFSCMKDNIFCVDLLLKSQCKIDCGNNENLTALHTACFHGSSGAANLLIRCGADYEARNSKGETPLHLACEKGSTTCVFLLLEEGADYTAETGEQITPLHSAAKGGQQEIIVKLLEMGADINAKTVNGETPATVASRSHLGCLKELLRGATLDITGNTSLIIGHSGIVEEMTTPLEAIYRDQQSALYIALLEGNEETRQLLLQRLVADQPKEEFISQVLINRKATISNMQAEQFRVNNELSQTHSYLCQVSEFNSPPELRGMLTKDMPTQELGPRTRQIMNNVRIIAGSMDPEEVMLVLYEHEIIPYEAVESANHSSLGPVTLGKRLLWLIEQMDMETKSRAFNVLREEGFSSLADQISGMTKGTSSLEEPKHWAVLRDQQKHLFKSLDDVAALCDHMLTKDVISEDDYEYINPGKGIGRKVQVSRLIEIVRRKSEQKFQMFMAILVECNQKHVAEPLMQRLQIKDCGTLAAIE